MATKPTNYQPVPEPVETARQKMIREIRERLEKERKQRQQGSYKPPTRVN